MELFIFNLVYNIRTGYSFDTQNNIEKTSRLNLQYCIIQKEGRKWHSLSTSKLGSNLFLDFELPYHLGQH